MQVYVCNFIVNVESIWSRESEICGRH